MTNKSKPTQASSRTALLENSYAWSVLVFIFFLFFYASSSVSEPIGVGISNELIEKSITGQLASSPGHIVLSKLIYLANQVSFLGSTAAIRAHRLAAIFGATTTAIVFSFLKAQHQNLSTKRKFFLINQPFESLFLATVATAWLGFSGYFWQSHLYIERASFSALLITIISTIAMSTNFQANQKLLSFALTGLAVGIGLTQHWLFFVALIWSFKLIKWNHGNFKQILNSLAVLLIPVVASLVAVWVIGIDLSQNKPIPGSWNAQSDLLSWVEQGYVAHSPLLSIQPVEWWGHIDIKNGLQILLDATTQATESFGFPAIIFIVISLLYRSRALSQAELSRYDKTVWLLLFTTIVLSIGSSAFSANLKKSEIIRNFLSVYPLITMLVWYGMFELIARFGQAAAVIYPKKHIWTGLVILLIVGPIGSYIINQKHIDFSILENISREHSTLFEKLEPDAIVVCFSLHSCQRAYYSQNVEGLRSDITIVPFYYKANDITLGQSDLQRFSYTEYPLILFDIITWNLDKRPVYSLDLFQEYYDFLGVEFGFVNYIPQGYYGQFTHQIPTELPEHSYMFSKNAGYKPMASWDLETRQLRQDIAQSHILNASIYMKMDLKPYAFSEMNLASNIFHQIGRKQSKEFTQLREAVESQKPKDFFAPGYKAPSVETIHIELEKLINNGLRGRALEVARGAVAVDPTNLNARFKWAQLLEESYASDSAQVEYQHILDLDPENSTALIKLGQENN